MKPTEVNFEPPDPNFLPDNLPPLRQVLNDLSDTSWLAEPGLEPEIESIVISPAMLAEIDSSLAAIQQEILAAPLEPSAVMPQEPEPPFPDFGLF